MGLEDRQYYRSEYDQPRGGFGGVQGKSIVQILVILNAAVFVVDMFSPRAADSDLHLVAATLSLPSNLLQEPWRIYGLLTYGFAHASWPQLMHVLINMFVLWMFGTDVESRLGRYEFLRYYLAAVLLSGVAWFVYVNVNPAYQGGRGQELVGASGAVMAVFALSVFYDPKRTLLIMGIVPAPAWLICAAYVAYDVIGMRGGSNVAHEAHLAGVGFAAVYFYSRWNLGRMFPGSFRLRMPKLGGTKLKVHRPESPADVEMNYRELEEEGDRILQKMHTQGEASLTAAERKTLEQYSRRMRQKHR